MGRTITKCLNVTDVAKKPKPFSRGACPTESIYVRIATSQPLAQTLRTFQTIWTLARKNYRHWEFTMPRITITIQAELDELEAECFQNNMDDENLDGQANLVKNIMTELILQKAEWDTSIDWKVKN
jgi:hypothetical protein